MQEYRNVGMLECSRLGIEKSRNVRILEYRNVVMYECRNAGMQGYRNVGL